MNIDQLLSQSLELLGLGMGAVFTLLILLIGIISIISKLVPEEIPVIPVKPNPVQTTATVDTHHIAAIQAAIHQFRKSR